MSQAAQSTSTDIHIAIRGLSKKFSNQFLYQNFYLEIPKAKITCIFGPNGCGKSTLLNMVSGLIPIDSGKITFEGKSLQQINFGYVFQNYREALFPWKRAIENIKYPLKVAGISQRQQNQRAEELIELFGIKIDFNCYPYQLSGGQQQLVSILRAFAIKPEVVFLDEPFSALDYEATLSIRDKLQDIFQASGVTIVMISHDLEEAVYMADRIVLLTKRPTHIAEEVDYDAPRPRTC